MTQANKIMNVILAIHLCKTRQDPGENYETAGF